MTILGIETSCDDTAIAVVNGEGIPARIRQKRLYPFTKVL